MSQQAKLPAQALRLTVYRRLKVAGHFYSEFSTPAVLPEAGAAAAAAPAAAASAELSAEEIAARVAGAVLAVMGSSVGPQQPLVEAGLDSLGAPCLLCITVQLTLHAKCSLCNLYPCRVWHKAKAYFSAVSLASDDAQSVRHSPAHCRRLEQLGSGERCSCTALALCRVCGAAQRGAARSEHGSAWHAGVRLPHSGGHISLHCL